VAGFFPRDTVFQPIRLSHIKSLAEGSIVLSVIAFRHVPIRIEKCGFERPENAMTIPDDATGFNPSRKSRDRLIIETVTFSILWC
jgi:hypothetical protein